MRLCHLMGSLLAGTLLTISVVADAQPADPAGDIIIGQSGAFSGPVAAGPLEFRHGAQTYFDLINASGGVNGRRVRLVSMDDALDPKKALANARAMLTEEPSMLAFFGFVGTGSATALIPYAEEQKIPYFAPLTGAMQFRRRQSPWVFHLRASYADEADSIVEQLLSSKMTRFAVLVLDDPLGKALFAELERAMREQRGQLLGSEVVALNADEAALAATARRLHALSPDAIILAGAGKPIVRFVRQARAVGTIAQIYSMSTVSIADLQSELGNQSIGIIISQIVPSPFRLAIGVSREFHAALEKTGSRARATHRSLEGFIAAKVLVEALRKAGPRPTRASLVKAFESMQEFDVGGMSVSYSPTKRQGSKFVDMVIIGSRGKIVN